MYSKFISLHLIEVGKPIFSDNDKYNSRRTVSSVIVASF